MGNPNACFGEILNDLLYVKLENKMYNVSVCLTYISFPPDKTTDWCSLLLYSLFKEFIQDIKYSIVSSQDNE